MPNLNLVKGLLIVSIVFAHSEYVRGITGYMSVFYFWHVQCFFLLVALRDGSRSAPKPIDTISRYLTPYIWIAGAIGLSRAVWADGFQAFPDALFFLVMGSTTYLSIYSGSVYWFMPSFAIVLIIWCWAGEKIKRAPLGVSVALALMLLFISRVLPSSILGNIPLGAGVVPYLVALVIIFDALRRVEKRLNFGILPVLFSLFLCTIFVLGSVSRGDTVSPGTFKFGLGWTTFLVAAIYPSLALILILRISETSYRVNFIEEFGRKSFDIFIFHQIFLMPITKVSELLGHQTFVGSAVAILAIPASIYLSLMLAGLLRNIPITKRYIFPKDWAELRGEHDSGPKPRSQRKPLADRRSS